MSQAASYLLHEMLPRKGIATFGQEGGRDSPENMLHEMLPRKGIATKKNLALLIGGFQRCTRCFPVRGLRQASFPQRIRRQETGLQEMLPRKGIATQGLGHTSS